MDTNESSRLSNKKLSKSQRVVRKRCKRYKTQIQKEYPGAHCKVTDNGLFYIADAFGIRILQQENRVNSPTVYDAWKQTALALHCCLEIERNSTKFNDDAVIMRMFKGLRSADRMR